MTLLIAKFIGDALTYSNVYVMNLLTIMFIGHELTYSNVDMSWTKNTAMARNSELRSGKFTANSTFRPM